MKTYTVLWPLLHNGTSYSPGEAVEMEQPQADILLSCGVIKETAPAKKTK